MLRVSLAVAALLILCSGPAAAMDLSSSDIAPGAEIPAAQIYPRCGGQNISPALSWNGVPTGTKSLVLTMIDVDVKPAHWSHWIVVDLPPGTTALARGALSLPQGAHGIASNFGDLSYDGPCPPNGTGVHHYQITIWAMGAAAISLSPDAKAIDLAALLKQKALDSATLTGWVSR